MLMSLSRTNSLDYIQEFRSDVCDVWWVPGWQVEEFARDFQWMERHKNKVIEGYRQEGDRICKERNSLRGDRDELLRKNIEQADTIAESQAALLAAEQRCLAAEQNADQLNQALQTDNKGKAEMAERLAILGGQLRYHKDHIDLLEDEKGSLHARLEAYRAEHGRMESDTENAPSPQLQQTLPLRFERPDSPSTATSTGHDTPLSHTDSSKENRTPPGSSGATPKAADDHEEAKGWGTVARGGAATHEAGAADAKSAGKAGAEQRELGSSFPCALQPPPFKPGKPNTEQESSVAGEQMKVP